MLKGELEEVAHREGLPGRNDEVIGLVLLQHPPHGVDVLRGITPVATSFNVAHEEGVLEASLDTGDTAGDLARYERLAAPRALVVEKDAVDREHSIGLAVVA